MSFLRHSFFSAIGTTLNSSYLKRLRKPASDSVSKDAGAVQFALWSQVAPHKSSGQTFPLLLSADGLMDNEAGHGRETGIGC